MPKDLAPEEAAERYASGESVVVDVRTHREWLCGHIPGALHIPLDELTMRHSELDPAAETLVVCAHGIRSQAAAEWLVNIGFENVANVRYGMRAWPGPVVLQRRP